MQWKACDRPLGGSGAAALLAWEGTSARIALHCAPQLLIINLHRNRGRAAPLCGAGLLRWRRWFKAARDQHKITLSNIMQAV